MDKLLSSGQKVRESKTGLYLLITWWKEEALVFNWSAQCSHMAETIREDVERRIVQKVFGILVVIKEFRSRTD